MRRAGDVRRSARNCGALDPLTIRVRSAARDETVASMTLATTRAVKVRSRAGLRMRRLFDSHSGGHPVISGPPSRQPPLLDSLRMATSAARARQAESRRDRRALGAGLGIRRHVPVRPVADARRDLLDRHAAADRQRLAAHGLRVRLRADRCTGALPAHAGPRGLLPDGLGRQRPRDRAARAELLRRALRSAPPVRRRFAPPENRRRRTRSRSRARTSSSCARISSSRTSRRSKRCGARSASRSTGRSPTRRSARRRAARVSARSCATSRAVRRTKPTRRRCGTSTSAPRSRRPSSKTARCPARTTRCASVACDGAGDLLIDTTRPELLAACVARRRAPRRRALPAAVRFARSRRRCTACAFPLSRTGSPIPRRERASR